MTKSVSPQRLADAPMIVRSDLRWSDHGTAKRQEQLRHPVHFELMSMNHNL